MKYKKPYYTLKINSEYCGYRITVNGCFIEVNQEGEPLNMEYPINQWLRSGTNKIEVFFFNTVHPITMQRQLASDAKLKCELLLRDFDEEIKTSVSIINFSGVELPRLPESVKVDYSDMSVFLKTTKNTTQVGSYEINNNQCIPNDNGDIKISETTVDRQYTKAIHLTQEVTLDTPFPEWAFFKGQDGYPIRTEMTEPQWNELREELLIEYQKLWDVVNEGSAKRLEPYLEARCLEYDHAFYTEPGENLKDFIKTINQDILDPDLTLRPFELKNFDISVSFNRKILWLHGDGNPLGFAFSFLIENSNLARKYPFYYSKINGEWVVVR